MKKTIYFLLTLLALNLLNCYGAFGGTLKDVSASCGYFWYGSGGHQGGVSVNLTIQGYDLLNTSGKWVSTIRALPEFHMRGFVDNWVVVPETTSSNQTFTLKTEPTEQNFYYDSYLKLQKASGHKVIWSASGCFDWYVPFLGGKSQRKTACYDPQLSPTNPNAWKDLAHLCKLIAERYKDNGLVDYIQVLNEWDFRWNVPHIITPEEYAVGFYESYKAIRSVSPNQKIMIGCTLTPEMATVTRFFDALDSISGKKIRDVIVTFNLYSRTKSANQGDGIGATFEEVDQFGRFLKPLNDFCKHEGLKWAMTETGYNSSPSTSASAMKNKAPSLEGYTLEEAQGILDTRILLICAALSECELVCIYHCRDLYEAEPFTYHGLNNKDWTAKPARTIIESYLKDYGSFDVSNFRKSGELYAVDLIASADTNTLVWSDKNKFGEYDAKPRIGTLIGQPPVEPPTTELKVSLSKSPFPDSKPLNGFTTTSGTPIYIYIDGTKPPYVFSNGQRESGFPYEYKGGQPVTFPDGTHTVTVTDGSGVIYSATFSVGAIITPPAKEPVLEMWYQDGKIFYRTDKRVISNYAE